MYVLTDVTIKIEKLDNGDVEITFKDVKGTTKKLLSTSTGRQAFIHLDNVLASLEGDNGRRAQAAIEAIYAIKGDPKTLRPTKGVITK